MGRAPFLPKNARGDDHLGSSMRLLEKPTAFEKRPEIRRILLAYRCHGVLHPLWKMKSRFMTFLKFQSKSECELIDCPPQKI
jgi:hypothetical protein